MLPELTLREGNTALFSNFRWCAGAQPSEDCVTLTSVVESNDQLSTFVDIVRVRVRSAKEVYVSSESCCALFLPAHCVGQRHLRRACVRARMEASLPACTSVLAPACHVQDADVLRRVCNDACEMQEAEIARPAEGSKITILAPTNDAITALGEEALDTLLQPENQGVLATLLQDHILVGGAVTAADIVDAGSAEYETANPGVSLSAEASGGEVTFTAPNNGSTATVTTPDLMSCVGVLHVIDAVLIRGGSQDEMTTIGAPAAAVGLTPDEAPAVAPSIFEVAPTPRGTVPDVADAPAMAPTDGAYGGYGEYGEYGPGGYGNGGYGMDAMAPDMA